MINHPRMNGRDRRRNQRIEVSSNVLKTQGVTALDLSESGMLLQTQAPHKRSSRIALDLALDGQSLLLQGEIMWCKESASIFTTDYRMGIRFVELKMADLLTLRDYVDRHGHAKEADRPRAYG